MDLVTFTARVEDVRSRALEAVMGAMDPDALQAVETSFLGRRGELKSLLEQIGQLPGPDRKTAGALGNPARLAVEEAIARRRERLDAIALEVRLAAEQDDVTLPGRPLRRGSLHPLMETYREIAGIFGQFGFVTYEGPEVETDELNFQALNIPPDHPSRDLWDTLYLRDGDAEAPRRLLRTHTSPVQIRAMREFGAPVRVLLPGRCFRYEAVDAGHASEFFQIEGLMVDEGTTLAHLRGLLDEVAHALFGAGRPTRFRPGYYPFTEPSVAFDVRCIICEGAGCPACKRTGWMTLLGAGMVRPVVLRNGGIDPERYQGFAFGMGTDRFTMQRHGIPDIRAFLDNDLRFLERL